MRIVFLCLITAAAAMAQSHGYVFVGPGVASDHSNGIALLHLGIGGEFVTPWRIGAGAEVGFVGRTDLGGVGAASLNGYYHFPRRGSWNPFATAGYSNFFAFGGSVNMANVGGGVNYWYKDHFGIKLEFRDHFGASVNYAEFRFGFTFK